MAHVVEEAKRYVFSKEEAYRSGRGGYRIGVELYGNPFKGELGDLWVKGWKDAAAADTSSPKRVDYSALEDRYSAKRPRNNRPQRGKQNWGSRDKN